MEVRRVLNRTSQVNQKEQGARAGQQPRRGGSGGAFAKKDDGTDYQAQEDGQAFHNPLVARRGDIAKPPPHSYSLEMLWIRTAALALVILVAIAGGWSMADDAAQHRHVTGPCHEEAAKHSKIGRASLRDRWGQYVSILVVSGSL